MYFFMLLPFRWTRGGAAVGKALFVDCYFWPLEAFWRGWFVLVFFAEKRGVVQRGVGVLF